MQPFTGLHSSATQPNFTQTGTCRGKAPPSCCARPFGRLKAPLGLSLLRFAAQTRTCRGKAPPSCYARPFGRLKAPLGLSLLRYASQTRTCRGGAPPSCCARPFGRLKAPLGLSLLRFAAQTRTMLFLLCTKSCIVWRKIGVWCSFYWKFIKRKSLKLLGTSRSFGLF